MTDKKYVRPTWDEYFMDVMNSASKRSTCDRGRSGCVIVMDDDILTTGYVGSPKGEPHCDDVGHSISTVTNENGETTEHCVRTVHAEANAIIRAANKGVSLKGATLYSRMTPCYKICAPMIVNCGIVRVVCERRYKLSKQTEELFSRVGIKIEYFNEEVQEYPSK